MRRKKKTFYISLGCIWKLQPRTCPLGETNDGSTGHFVNLTLSWMKRSECEHKCPRLASAICYPGCHPKITGFGIGWLWFWTLFCCFLFETEKLIYLGFIYLIQIYNLYPQFTNLGNCRTTHWLAQSGLNSHKAIYDFY